jgi:hypothetical protein
VECTYAQYEWIVMPAEDGVPDFNVANLALIDQASETFEIVTDQLTTFSLTLNTGKSVTFDFLFSNNGSTHVEIKGLDVAGGSKTWSSPTTFSGWLGSNKSKDVTFYACNEVVK